MRFPAKTATSWGAGMAMIHRSDALAHATSAIGLGSLNRCLDKIVVCNQRGNPDQSLLDTIMRAVENNGQVTLPVTRLPWNPWKIAAGIAAGLGAVGALVVLIFR